MRVVLVLLVVAVLAILVLTLLRRSGLAPPRMPTGTRDELVKDPVCQTYVVRSRAVRARGADGPPYFCSADCARRYAG